MLATAYSALLVLTLVGIGWPLAARLDRAGALSAWERVAPAFLLGALAAYLAVFAVGLVRYDRLAMAALSVALLAAAAPGWRRLPWRGLAGSAAALVDRRDPWLALLTLAAAGIGLSSLLQGLAPPNDYDSLVYHLTLPKLDLEIGRIEPHFAPGLVHFFFPALMHNLYRLALATVGEPAVQLVHGWFGLMAALATGQVAMRLGFGRAVAVAAALMLLSLRVVVWEMATAEVDTGLATTLAAGMVVYLGWRRRWDDTGLAVLFGLLLGAGLCVKNHGLAVAAAFAVAMLADLAPAGQPRFGRVARMALSGAVALACLAPHAAWVGATTGNPLFPLFQHNVFPGAPDFFAGLRIQYGIPRDLLGVLITPWVMSVAPMQHYDGMVQGAPYFLALAPVALLARRRFAPGTLACLLVLAVYYVVWFFGLSQQVRFLMPVFPLLAVLAAIGAAALWRAAAGSRLLRGVVAAQFLVLAANQGVFVGMYAALRLPAALGWMSPADYHAKTPTMTGGNYHICQAVNRLLRPGERYLSLITPNYYCPQGAAITAYFPFEGRDWIYRADDEPVSRADMIRGFETYGLRWVVVPTAVENRRNDTGKSVMVPAALSKNRLGRYLEPALVGLAPVEQVNNAAIYDGGEVLARLRALADGDRKP